MRIFYIILLLSLLAITKLSGQTRTITGLVTDRADGGPIPGVSVRVAGTTTGVATGSDGRYSLTITAGQATLQFSSVGYAVLSIPVGNSNIVNAALVANNRELNEVVVTANAIRREKRTLGYSAPTINNAELTQGQNPNVINSLTGHVAGVNITTTSNTPGASSRVVLRGGSSIAGNNQALIVVDGFPIDNSSVIGGGSSLSSVDFGNRGNDINPEDIESVTVLKGPAAAALYGSRASNGALIITTKSGKQGAKKMEITFSTSNAFSSVLKLPDLQNEYGQGYYTNIDAQGNASYYNDPKENWSWGAPFTGEVQPWGQQIDGTRLTKPYQAFEDNVRNFFETGFSTDNNLSFSGGGEKTSFFLGLNSLNSNSIFPGNKDVYDRYNVRFNGTAAFSNKFSAGIAFNFSHINSNQVAGGQAGGSVYNNVLQTPRDIPLQDLKDLNNKFYGYGYTDSNGIRQDDRYGYYGAYTMNPYWILANYNNINEVNRITGNFNIGYKPFDWLDIKERVGIDTYTDRRRQESPKYSFVPADEAGNYSASANPAINNGSYQIDQFNVNELVHDLMITASHKFDDNFEGSLMIGNNIRQRNTSTNSQATNASGGLVVPGWYNLANSNGPINVISDYLSKRRLIGLYADLNLSFRKMLFLEATARNDWSSTLPASNRSFFYPSVSLSFLFSELLKDNEAFGFLSYGKLRSSYAQVGNDTDPYQLMTTFSRAEIIGGFGSTTFPFGNVAALMAGSTIGNPDLKPEKTNSFEVGTELGLFNNRLSVDFSYYSNNSKNQILSIPIPTSTGFGFSVVNAGEVRNRGVELSLRGTPIKTNSGFSVELFATYTKNNSEVVELMPGIEQVTIGGYSGMSIVAAVGRPYGEFYAVNNLRDEEGRTVIDRQTGIPLQTPAAEYLGSYNPKYQASIGTNIRYGNFSLSALFDTKRGGVFYSRTRDITGFNGTSAESGGPRIGVLFPNSVYRDAQGNMVVNTTATYNKQDYYSDLVAGQHIVDASFVKLRTLSISYQFAKSFLNKTPFGALSVGLFGNNLFIWTPKSNQFADPEVNSAGAGNAQGFDYTAQPSVRNYGINLRASF
ncbi:SusC/RagA family TonB-linked outer membrane protein [Pedobacter sp. Leaf176]|uniref:SusC/RagA family TonB-linked outer membrane protein n=1 Tax=Pedobacter sp. Leaf176 TaxID=1736286 RepID=UPI0006FDFCF1|nr:SusC/RagA family TonB-linked outer membrane protein [Pedobacter sp. Leaf176]KQR71014.1 SusC/RagA family TonB-linked outer membrane protein [Pedobacter sp. Leaf176]